MEITSETGLEKFEKEGKANEVFSIIRGKEYTLGQIASTDYIF